MTKIVFTTSGDIDYQLDGRSLYESISLTAKGEVFPSLTSKGRIEVSKFATKLESFHFKCIYTAPTKQCLETAKILSKALGTPVKVSKRLLPLKFELEDLFTEKEFNDFKEMKFLELRKRFVNKFFKDKLIDKNKEISQRFKYLCNQISREFKGKSLLIVSHAYLIKLFSIYYQVGDKMYENKELLIKLFNLEKESMKRLEMLEIEI